MSDPLYVARAHVTGGRAGHAETDDGKLRVDLAYPPALGGDGNGTNPEQLFAAGYGACFLGALGMVARREKIDLGEHALDAEVTLTKDATSFVVGARLKLHAPALDRDEAMRLLQAAHQVCPYSRATRGNIDVELSVA